MTVLLSEILDQYRTAGVLEELLGSDKTVQSVAPVGNCSREDLVFLEDAAHADTLRTSPPAAVVTTRETAAELSALGDLSILISSNVRLAQALIRKSYFDYDIRTNGWPRIHASAVVHESVNVPATAVIEPGAVIGSNVKLGERVVIQANAVIEQDAVVGDDTIIQAGVFIGHGCRIGNRVLLKPGCVIGGEGFGFAPDAHKHYHRIPQTGTVVIEDDVTISANCTVDRATYAETRICRGCKIDALCHIAHNDYIGEDCILVAQTGIAGSTRLGKRVIASGQTGILDHITIADDVVLVHRCGVNADISKPGMYGGTPPLPFRDYARNVKVSAKLSELWRAVKELEKKFKQLTSA